MYVTIRCILKRKLLSNKQIMILKMILNVVKVSTFKEVNFFSSGK